MQYPFQNGIYKIGKASDLIGKDRKLYRFFECIPGILAWGTIILSIIASYFIPLYAAIFIIAFDVYWFTKTIFLSIHMRKNWKKLKKSMLLDWYSMVSNIANKDYYHLVILPYYKEDYDIVSKSLEAIKLSKTDLSKIIICLAGEERAGEKAKQIANLANKDYGDLFGHFIITMHPSNILEEMPGKGSNISYACEEIRKKILDKNLISYSNVIVSAFDIDTVVYEQYFSCLLWNVLNHRNPLRASFQPVPLYNNNIWEAPALSSVVAFSGTFWQMIQQERPERLTTFSSHAMIFETLYQIGYWQKNMVSEDSRIFWNCYMKYDGEYETVPIFYPVSMDTNLAPTFWGTMKNIYKQQRRWSWGAENLPYILFSFLKNKNISIRKKIKIAFIQIEGIWSLSTNPLLIFLLGWLPVIIGRGAFQSTILSYNLPIITRDIMIATMFGLVLSSYIAISLLPPMPNRVPSYKKIIFIFQWIFVPITITIFGAIPALDAQTRLLFGKYMGFWVTPKHRHNASLK